MANRDFNKIKRTIQDFSLNAGSGSGGVVKVTELPEKGEENVIYELTQKKFNWFSSLVIRKYEDQTITTDNNTVLVENYENLPETHGSDGGVLYITYDNKKVYEYNFDNQEYVEIVPDGVHVNFYFIKDFNENNVTLLNGEVEPYKESVFNEDDELVVNNSYIYLFQNTSYLEMYRLSANNFKNFYETKIINSEDELPIEGPEHSFLDNGDSDKYTYFDKEGYIYEWIQDGEELSPSWHKSQSPAPIFTEIQDDRFENYILDYTASEKIEKYVYENDNWINISDYKETCTIKLALLNYNRIGADNTLFIIGGVDKELANELSTDKMPELICKITKENGDKIVKIIQEHCDEMNYPTFKSRSGDYHPWDMIEGYANFYRYGVYCAEGASYEEWVVGMSIERWQESPSEAHPKFTDYALTILE